MLFVDSPPHPDPLPQRGRESSPAEFNRIVVGPQFTIRHLTTGRASFEPHAHTAYTVATLLDGCMTGRIGEQDIDLRPGMSALVNTQETHAAETEGCEVVSVALSPSLVDELLIELSWYHPDAWAEFQAPTTDDEVIAGLARTFAHELAHEQPGQSAMLDALVRQLALHLLRTRSVVRRHPSMELSRAGPVDRRLRRAIELIHTRFAEDLSLKEMADSVYLSEYHFAHLFKTLTGRTPHGYLANIRIEQARALLLQTRLPITQIAPRVGYRSASHFAHAFKGVSGVSPTDFRAGLSTAHSPTASRTTSSRAKRP